MNDRKPPALPIKQKKVMPPLPIKLVKASSPIRSEVSQVVEEKMSKPIPALSKDKSRMYFELNNNFLNETQYNCIINGMETEYTIIYSGNFEYLYSLICQLGRIRNKFIRLVISNVEVADNIYLPFHLLGLNIALVFTDSPQLQSNFNTYLINSDDVVFESAAKHLNPMEKERMYSERKIQKEFTDELLGAIDKRGKTVDSYTKTQLMDLVFGHVCDNYPYDGSITDHGHWKMESSTLGGTAYIVHKRGKGICEGRSKLIKLLANNKKLKLQCYLAYGKFKTDGHAWNEFIDEYGNIIEYDSSFKKKYTLVELPHSGLEVLPQPPYELENHEPDVDKILKKGRL